MSKAAVCTWQILPIGDLVKIEVANYLHKSFSHVYYIHMAKSPCGYGTGLKAIVFVVYSYLN